MARAATSPLSIRSAGRPLEQARRALDVVKRLLLKPSPDALLKCQPHLEEAIDSMRVLEQAVAAAPAQAGVRSQLETLRRELAEVNALLVAAGTFYANWARLLAPDETVNYARAGMAAAPAGPQLVVRG